MVYPENSTQKSVDESFMTGTNINFSYILYKLNLA